MKLNKIFTFAALSIAMFFAVSCNDTGAGYDGPGAWDAADGYANIYFPITDSILELDPVDPTIVTATLSRRNTQGALTVSLVVEENTDNVFTVTDATFADGQAEAEFTLSFPNAEVGKPYTLKLTSYDSTLVSPTYSSGVIYTLEVTRVKWNDVGFYYADADKTEKVEGWAMYTDAIVGNWFGLSDLTFPTRIQERDDMEGYFRLINTYDGHFLHNEEGDWDESKNYYIYIDATDPEKVYIPSECDLGLDWGYGSFSIYSYAGYYLSAAERYADAGDVEAEENYRAKAESYYGKYENGTITFPENSLLRSMANYNNGGLYIVSSDKFKLVIDPDLNPYEADITSDDFEWEEVYAGLFESAQLGTQTEGVKLYKGTCVNNTDSCDVRFAEEYGTAYKIESPYTDGYDLYFAVNEDGEVTLPEDLTYQNTGMKAVGTDVYAVISPAASTFTERLITLKITFQSLPDEDGIFTEYASAEEVLSCITWTKVGTGIYTYTSFFADYDEETDEDIPYADGPLDIYQRDDEPTIYKVTDWGYGADFIFTWDGKDGDGVTVPVSFTGYPSAWGDVYVSDIPTWNDTYDYTQFPNTYDADSQTFSFNVVYWCEQGMFANSEETLEVNWGASSTSRAAATKKRLSTNKAKTRLANKKQHSWFGKGTKVNVKNKKALPVSAKAPLFVK